MNIEAIKNSPKSSGKPHLLRYAEGNAISRVQAMKAKCCECMNGYVDGLDDCGVSTCPLYPWMPYRKAPAPKKAPVKRAGRMQLGGV